MSPEIEESTQDFVDADDDGLDDRLTTQTVQENETIKDVLIRLERIQLRTLPEETIQSMIGDIESDQRELVAKAQEMERHVHQEIVHGRSHILKKLRKSIRILNRRYEQLQEEKEEFIHVIQQQRLQANLEKLIGVRLSLLLERTVLTLVVLVLVLLFYDFSVERAPDHVLHSWNVFYIDMACCVVFLGDFFLRLACADDKWWFWKHHWIDFVTSIPIPPADSGRFLRLGRATRILRFIRVLRVLRLFRAMYFFWRGMEKLSDLFDIKMMKRSVRWAITVIFFGALAIMKVEGEQEGIQNGVEFFSHSLWWSFTTVVTGGFGDIYNPTTFWGQIITGMLVITGMILIGVFTANLTTLYIGEETDDLNILSENIDAQLKTLKTEMKESFQEQRNLLKEMDAQKK